MKQLFEPRQQSIMAQLFEPRPREDEIHELASTTSQTSVNEKDYVSETKKHPPPPPPQAL